MRQTAKTNETKSITGHIGNLHDDVASKNYLWKFNPEQSAENYVSQLQKPNNIFLYFP